MTTRTAKPARRSRSTPATGRPQRVVVPTDFSAGSRRALDYARSLARGNATKLLLVHVVMPVTSPDLIYASPVWDQTKINRAAEAAMQNWRGEAGLGRDQRVQTRVCVGVPWREINDAARRFKADMIVISTHGRTGLSHYLLGSTAEQVIRHAVCPVLVVRVPKPD